MNLSSTVSFLWCEPSMSWSHPWWLTSNELTHWWCWMQRFIGDSAVHWLHIISIKHINWSVHWLITHIGSSSSLATDLNHDEPSPISTLTLNEPWINHQLTIRPCRIPVERTLSSTRLWLSMNLLPWSITLKQFINDSILFPIILRFICNSQEIPDITAMTWCNDDCHSTNVTRSWLPWLHDSRRFNHVASSN